MKRIILLTIFIHAFLITQGQNINQFGLWVGVSYGQDFGEMKGLNTIIDSYNEHHAERLKDPMSSLSMGQNLNVSGELMLNQLFVNIGVSLSSFGTNSVLNDRANQLYKYRFHLHLLRTSFTTQLGYTFHLNDYLKLIAGGRMELGNYRFMTKTVPPTHYESFTQSEYRQRDKYRAIYGGGFGRLVLGNSEKSPFLFFVEGQYVSLLNEINLAPMNEALNPDTFQDNGHDGANLGHQGLGIKVGLAISLFTD